ncbi:GNAT family N-acetyltransferase [Haloflavibacter putidus]|uniref:GNAT family N-acetyltransferase n=1 Tax=Haloflavibacter putidus TaxID=2576776 RepID=A0A507ZX40_9FLAO|nr:GNAT family N-acetyltransferase [Haloflavibacter putidus]TQD39335.1 GNAT family N-acetyltransferase [Haloflavibacter putidus]
MQDINIRLIQPDDNQQIARVIREVLVESGAPKTGTAYEDKSLDQLFETYRNPGEAYFVVEKNREILGGAGIAALEVENENYCELQKMYFLKTIRGCGIGSAMMQKCLQFAKENAYTHCYIETLPYMKAAQKLYQRSGFNYINQRLGNTGHHNCDVWMLKNLRE